MIDFPDNPIIGQTFTAAGLTWQWTGIVWDLVATALKTPVDIKYNNVADMIADQANQTEDYIYYASEEDTYYTYLGTTNGDINDYDVVGAPAEEQIPPVENSYTDAAEMYADQENQKENYIYYVENEDLYYRYLGTENGNSTDYELINVITPTPTLDEVTQEGASTSVAISSPPAVNSDELVNLGQVQEIINNALSSEDNRTVLLTPGVVQWTNSGYTFDISRVEVLIRGEFYTFDSGQVTLSAADPVNNRIDVIAINTSGIFVIPGVADPNPIEPSLNSEEDEIRLTAITVTANTTTPQDIDGQQIYDENLEWIVTSTGTATVDPNDLSNPFVNTKSINVSSTTNNYTLIFTANNDQVFEDYDSLSFRLNLKEAVLGTIQVRFYDENNQPVSNARNILFDKTLVGSYQFVAIPLGDFILNEGVFRQVRITYRRVNSQISTQGLFIDDVKLQFGIFQPISSKNTPVDASYVDIDTLLNAQNSQKPGFIYFVESESTYYEFLGTKNNAIEDYRAIGGGTTNNIVQVIYINPNLLSGNGTIEEQICEYINANVEIDYSRQYSKLNIILGIDPNIPQIEIVYGFLYSAPTTSDPRNISSSDDWIVPVRGISPDGGWSQFFNVPFIGNSVGQRGDVTNIKDTTVGIWNDLNSAHNNSRGLKIRPAGHRDNIGFGGLGDGVQLAYNVSGQWTTDRIFFDGQSAETTVGSPGTPSFATPIRLVKNNTLLSPGQTGTYTGNDGHVYNTLCIDTNEGPQEWLVDNLIETQFRNGDPIPEITDQTAWNNFTGWGAEGSARCSYNNLESNAFIIEGQGL